MKVMINLEQLNVPSNVANGIVNRFAHSPYVLRECDEIHITHREWGENCDVLQYIASPTPFFAGEMQCIGSFGGAAAAEIERQIKLYLKLQN